MEYAAFLLGINLGKRSVKMADLKALMEKLGYKNVRTVLASGNVRFEAGNVAAGTLERKLEVAYKEYFGFEIGVIIRTISEIEKMIAAEPFKKVMVREGTRRFVMFLAQKPPTKKIEPPKDPSYKILKVTDGEVYSVLELSKTVTTPDVMKLVGKTYGKKMTTRNWNTIEKIAALADT